MAAAAEVDELISDLVDGGKVARREAARSLALIGPEAKAAVPALARALDDDEVQVFFWSATALAFTPVTEESKTRTAGATAHARTEPVDRPREPRTPS
mgnify:CR=1 FL=1